MTFDIGLHEVCVRVGVRYVITKFSRIDSLPNFLTHGAPQARASRARAPLSMPIFRPSYIASRGYYQGKFFAFMAKSFAKITELNIS